MRGLGKIRGSPTANLIVHMLFRNIEIDFMLTAPRDILGLLLPFKVAKTMVHSGKG